MRDAMTGTGTEQSRATVNKVQIIGKLSKVSVAVSDDAASALAVTLVYRNKQNRIGCAFKSAVEESLFHAR
jgi:hypothetical protein